MITEQQVELIVERLTRRAQQANIYFLMNIGSSVRKIRSLKPSEAHRLIQMLKYGTTYDEIVRELAKYTDLNIKEIDKIFEEYAKKDIQFYEQFYDYRNKLFTPFEENAMAQQQEQIIANVVKSKLYDFTRQNVLGYTIRDLKGNPQFVGLKETYNRVLDEALMNINQGKENFDSALYRILKDIGGSGLKTIDYESGRHIRLDSAITNQLKDGLQQLHLQNQMLYGTQFDSDGVEITVHENPAPDHENVQGRQFSNEQFQKLQNGEDAKDYKGTIYNLDHDNKNGYRPIGDLNCYHNVYPIILGVSEPEYTDEQLQQIINKANQKVEIDGKQYTRYQCTQLQRRLETQARKQKDAHILGKTSNNENLIMESQYNITKITDKYREVSKKAGLPTYMERMRVSDYRRVSSKSFDNRVKKLYNVGTKQQNAQLYFQSLRRQQRIKDGQYNLNIIESKQLVHNKDSQFYIPGKSYFDIDLQQQQQLVNQYAGSGFIPNTSKGKLSYKEICTTDHVIGKYINKNTGKQVDTNSFVIHYSKKGVHIVPADYREVDKK